MLFSFMKVGVGVGLSQHVLEITGIDMSRRIM